MTEHDKDDLIGEAIKQTLGLGPRPLVAAAVFLAHGVGAAKTARFVVSPSEIRLGGRIGRARCFFPFF